LLNPYLNFRGTTREAMQWYQEVFGGELTISTFAELHGSMDPSEDDLVMHSDLQGPDGIRFMAADVPNRMEYAPGTNNFSMSLSGEDGGRAPRVLRQAFGRRERTDAAGEGRVGRHV